jgi:peroxiredoxin (alkyl hydroperoxide reductase subunit C)
MGVLVGKKAPEFQTKAVVKGGVIAEFSLNSLRGKYVVLFFYPLDFTFVCPTELHAFQQRLSEFHERNTEVIGCSVDSPFCHVAWLNTPKTEGGIQGITYPLVSDLNKSIAHDYDVLVPGEGIAYRGLFLIDREGVVRHQVVNDLPLGRSVDETLRTLDALIFFEKHGEVCPADWRQGKESLQATQAGLRKYFALS